MELKGGDSTKVTTNGTTNKNQPLTKLLQVANCQVTPGGFKPSTF